VKLTTKQLKQIIKEELCEVFAPTRLGHYAKRAHKRRGAEMDPEEIKKLGGFDRSDPEMAAGIDDMYGIKQEPMPDEMGMTLPMMIQDNMDYIVDFEINRKKMWGNKTLEGSGGGYLVKDPDGTAWYSTDTTLRGFARRIVNSLDNYMAGQIGNNENIPFSFQEFETAMRNRDFKNRLVQQALGVVENMVKQGEARIDNDPNPYMLNPANNKRVFFIKL